MIYVYAFIPEPSTLLFVNTSAHCAYHGIGSGNYAKTYSWALRGFGWQFSDNEDLFGNREYIPLGTFTSFKAFQSTYMELFI